MPGGAGGERGRGEPGAQRRGADFLTLPEAIRAAAPHGEFTAAEAGRAAAGTGGSAPAAEGRGWEGGGRDPPVAGSGCAVRTQPAQAPEPPIRAINA